MSRYAQVPVRAGLLAAPVALLVVAPDPADAWRGLLQPTTDPTGPVLAVVALLAWALAAYVVAGGLLVLAGRLPGALGRCAAALAARTVPAAVRRSLAVALGTSLALGTTGALPAGAAPLEASSTATRTATSGTGTTLSALALDTAARTVPGSVPSTALSLDWPTAPAAPADPPPGPPERATVTVVRPGDSLWSLAERDLRAAGRTASPAAVAAAWPSWWAANREAVGADPHLLLPGTELVSPPEL